MSGRQAEGRGDHCGEESWKGQGFSAAADEMIRNSCGDCPGGKSRPHQTHIHTGEEGNTEGQGEQGKTQPEHDISLTMIKLKFSL